MYFAIALAGLLVAPFANWGVYNLAYFPRNIGPWRKAPVGCSSRTWFDCIPVLGWLRLKRESEIHGKGFWIRPLLLELLFPIFLVWLYHFEMSGGLLDDGPMLAIVMPKARWIQFCAHSVLLLLLLIATFIDLDERCIPDTVTLPATLAALIGAAAFQDWHLYYLEPNTLGEKVVHLHPASPYPWNMAWNGISGLWLALFFYSIWCFSLMDRRLILRRGWKKAIQYFIAALFRHWTWKILAGIWIVGIGLICYASNVLPVANWQSLFSSILGMTIGCSVVWMIRIIAGMAMGVEAMGFGDVTLMAMVGAFLGWQPTWLAFFAAPILALLIVLFVWLITGDRATPFGPYLAAGSVVVLLGWNPIWNSWAVPRVWIIGGPLLFWGFLSFLVLLGGTLWILLQVKKIFRR